MQAVDFALLTLVCGAAVLGLALLLPSHSNPTPAPTPPAPTPPAPSAPPAPPAPTPAPTPPAPPTCPGGVPNGSGTCPSDDYPPVPPVPWPPACPVSAAQVQAQRSYERWTSSVPLFGPLVSGLRQLSGYQTVAQELQEEQAAAAAELQAGATQYQDSYTIFLGDMAPQVYAVAKDVLGPGGYIDVVTQYATLPLVYAAHDLIAPVVALFCCALILVWAV